MHVVDVVIPIEWVLIVNFKLSWHESNLLQLKDKVGPYDTSRFGRVRNPH